MIYGGGVNSYGFSTFMIATFPKYRGNKVSTVGYLLPGKNVLNFVTFANLATIETRSSKMYPPFSHLFYNRQ